MRVFLRLLPLVTGVMFCESAVCQPFNAAEKASALQAAKQVVVLTADNLKRTPDRALNAWGLTTDRLHKLALADLGDACPFYVLSSEEILKLTRIEDITELAWSRGIEFPVLIDESVTLSITMRPVVDSTATEVVWKEAGFGGGSGGKIGRTLELSKKYPASLGYDMIHVYLSGIVDFYVIKKGSDYIIYNGYRTINGSIWGRGNDSDFTRILSIDEFLDAMRAFAKRYQGGGTVYN